MNGRKGKSSLLIYGKHPELRGKYRNRAFWRRGCRADTEGENIQETEESFDVNRTRIRLGNARNGEFLTRLRAARNKRIHAPDRAARI